MEVMIGNSNTLPLTATYRYGHTGIVSSKSDYEISNDVIEIKDGQVKGLKEGVANVTAAYTDPLNNTKTTDFTVRSTFFPFSAQYIKTNLFAQGTDNGDRWDGYITVVPICQATNTSSSSLRQQAAAAT